MNKSLFSGSWRSYKVFYGSGAMRRHTLDSYVELSINSQNLLTITVPHTRVPAVQTTRWEIKEISGNYFLYAKGKEVYQILTLDPDEIVLADNVKGEKDLPGAIECMAAAPSIRPA